MEKPKVPLWTLEELQAWVAGAKTGTLVFEFECGTPKKVHRNELVAPPLPRGATGATVRPVPICPNCGPGPLRELDYGDKYECGRCGIIWSFWDLRRRGKVPAA